MNQIQKSRKHRSALSAIRSKSVKKIKEIRNRYANPMHFRQTGKTISTYHIYSFDMDLVADLSSMKIKKAPAFITKPLRNHLPKF